MSRKTVHTTPHSSGGWQNKSGGASKASGIFPTKSQAQQAGKQIAQNKGAEHVIHNKDGKIGQSNSYGNDPNPPKDTK